MSLHTPSTESAADRDASGERLLAVDGLKKHFDQADGFLDRLVGDPGSVRAVDGVDLTIREGETLAVVGESGCGKSTLGRTILNLHQPTAGRVRYKGEDIAGLSDKEMRPYRRDLQMIFQDPLASLNPRQTVGQILKAPMEIHGDTEYVVRTTTQLEGSTAVDDEYKYIAENEDEVERAREATEERGGTVIDVEERAETERVKELLERVGLKSGHIDRYPHQFSGGQQQRVGIARALALEPELIIADEPVSALDVSVQAQILNLLDDLQEELGLSLLFIAHNLSVVRHIADRVAVMYLGEIVETAPTEELFENPQHPYTKSLLSAVPRIDASDRTDRVILEGTVPSPISPPSGCRFHTRCPAVIPPADWSGTQGAFKSAFTFRNRALDGEIDPEAIETQLESAGERADETSVAARILDQSLPGEPADLPDDAAETVRVAADALAAGDDEAATSLLTDAFPSPCERDAPTTAVTGNDHMATCHRVDPNAPGDADVL